jgi:hypothetical protein
VRDLVDSAIALVERHPSVSRVEFAGSRSRGTHEELSDWDFAVETEDFDAVARDLPALVAPLEPVGAQWEPVGHFPVYQVMLEGPTKVEYLFLDHRQDRRPPLQPSEETLPAIDTHFWDWIWWIGTKAAAGHDDLVADHLAQMHEYLLRPLGVTCPPATIASAIAAFRERRRALGGSPESAMEQEVTAGLARLGLTDG